MRMCTRILGRTHFLDLRGTLARATPCYACSVSMCLSPWRMQEHYVRVFLSNTVGGIAGEWV